MPMAAVVAKACVANAVEARPAAGGPACSCATYQHVPVLAMAARTTPCWSPVVETSYGWTLMQFGALVPHPVEPVHVYSGADEVRRAEIPEKDCPALWYWAVASVRALVRFDWAARSLAELVTPRKVGMAMASRMAMMSRTTMSSISVKPASASPTPSSSAVCLSRRRSSTDWNMTSSYIGNGYRLSHRHSRGVPLATLPTTPTIHRTNSRNSGYRIITVGVCRTRRRTPTLFWGTPSVTDRPARAAERLA